MTEHHLILLPFYHSVAQVLHLPLQAQHFLSQVQTEYDHRFCNSCSLQKYWKIDLISMP